jgi:ADP-ribose pyrophosphatase YjhB (NUDIX family)
MARFSSSSALDQAAISSNVRQQPRHHAFSVSIWQTLLQGERTPSSI